jgi:hypothetical protein
MGILVDVDDSNHARCPSMFPFAGSRVTVAVGNLSPVGAGCGVGVCEEVNVTWAVQETKTRTASGSSFVYYFFIIIIRKTGT